MRSVYAPEAQFPLTLTRLACGHSNFEQLFTTEATPTIIPQVFVFGVTFLLDLDSRQLRYLSEMLWLLLQVK
jgi:hypothetical protein